MERERLPFLRFALAVGLALSLGRASSAWSWGAEGHEAICEIAYRELTPKTAAKVDALVASDPSIATFRTGCVWPDFDGEEQDRRRPEHYVNVPRTWSALSTADCPRADRCLFTAIRRDSLVLGSKDASARERLYALRFLGHWVGDIHQPLHVSYGDDRGGNDVLVRPDLGCRRTLHDLWDNCMPKDLGRKTGVGRDAAALGKALQAEVTPQQRAAWLVKQEPLAWANESYAIAREPGVRYCVLTERACDYSKTRARFDGHGRRRSESLSQAYEDGEEPTVRERLQQAGVRLAALLERLLGSP